MLPIFKMPKDDMDCYESLHVCWSRWLMLLTPFFQRLQFSTSQSSLIQKSVSPPFRGRKSKTLWGFPQIQLTLPPFNVLYYGNENRWWEEGCKDWPPSSQFAIIMASILLPGGGHKMWSKCIENGNSMNFYVRNPFIGSAMSTGLILLFLYVKLDTIKSV